VYKVFDLRDYRLLYKIHTAGIKEIKISPGVMLVIHEQQMHHVLLKILNMYVRSVGILPTDWKRPGEDASELARENRRCSQRPARGVEGEGSEWIAGRACRETGETLKEFKHPLHPNKRIDFIEQFNEKLLVKQGAFAPGSRSGVHTPPCVCRRRGSTMRWAPPRRCTPSLPACRWIYEPELTGNGPGQLARRWRSGREPADHGRA